LFLEVVDNTTKGTNMSDREYIKGLVSKSDNDRAEAERLKEISLVNLRYAQNICDHPAAYPDSDYGGGRGKTCPDCRWSNF
jgi:hypothetical protein